MGDLYIVSRIYIDFLGKRHQRKFMGQFLFGDTSNDFRLHKHHFSVDTIRAVACTRPSQCANCLSPQPSTSLVPNLDEHSTGTSLDTTKPWEHLKNRKGKKTSKRLLSYVYDGTRPRNTCIDFFACVRGQHHRDTLPNLRRITRARRLFHRKRQQCFHRYLCTGVQ